jgi:hypothetical protein
MGTVGIIVILVIVFVAIFLLLREVNCWYWKINERITLMNEQNDLLRKLVSNINYNGKVEAKAIKVKPIETPIEKLDENDNNNSPAPEMADQSKISGVATEILDKLSPAKRYKLERLIEDMGKTDIIVIHDNTVKLLNKERWDGIVSSGASDNYEIIYTYQSPN